MKVARVTIPDVEVGDVLDGKYAVLRELGEGGFGRVFAVKHRMLGSMLAVKVLRAKAIEDVPGITARFLREARAASRLKSDHVAKVLDFGEAPGGVPYMVMDLLEGRDLSALLETGPLDPAIAVSYIMQACEALAEAHALGVIHRDIKPANLFLTQHKGAPFIKVLDFGIATAGNTDEIDGSLTQTHAVMGSPIYTSPEQQRTPRDVDARTDIWSLGVTLYELIAGKPPFFERVYGALVLKIATEQHAPISGLNPKLAAVLDRALAKRPSDRYADVTQFARALSRFTDHGSASADEVERLFTTSAGGEPPNPHAGPEETTIVGSIGSEPPRKKWVPIAIGAAAVATFGVIAGVIGSSGGSPALPDAGLVDLGHPVVTPKHEETSSGPRTNANITGMAGSAEPPPKDGSATGTSSNGSGTGASDTKDGSGATGASGTSNTTSTSGTSNTSRTTGTGTSNTSSTTSTKPKRSTGSTGSTTTSTTTTGSATAPSDCDYSELFGKGASALGANADAEAVVWFSKAYACKPDPNALALATIAACKDGDVVKAKAFFKKLPASKTSMPESRCAALKVPLK